MGELFIVVSLYAKDGKEADLRRDLTNVVEPSRREEGSLRYDLFVDQNDPRRSVFVEHWASTEARDKHHNEGDHIRHFQDHGAANVERTEIACFLNRIA